MSATHAPGRLGTGDGPAGSPAGSERLYAALLHAYPSRFRARYGSEMVQLFADQLRDARAGRAAGGVAITWLRTLTDLATSAVGEHLRKDRTMAQSMATFEPTRTMRLLGLFGMVGGALLLMAFVTFVPFEDLAVNTVRLIVFALSGVAISIAFHGRQAVVSPRLALIATGAVVIAGLWYALWTVLSLNVPSRFSGTFGFIGALASLALWLTPTFYGASMLRIRAAWQGMSRWRGVAARLGAIFLLGSVLAVAGDDRFGLVDSEPYGRAWSTIALLGVFLNGAGWVLLGAVLVFGGRRTPAGNPSS